MRRLKLKVCGMTEPTNIAEIASLGPDYLGFIFYKDSKRFVVDGLMLAYLSLRPELSRVGVFVDAEIDAIRYQVEESDLAAVQLSGDESAEYCSKLRQALGDIEIFKSLDPSDPSQLKNCFEYAHSVNTFIFDNKASSFGGSGRCFDWNALHAYSQDTPYFISGGIGPSHICELKRLAESDRRLIGIDINSKVEHQPGLKDRAAVHRIIEELRA